MHFFLLQRSCGSFAAIPRCDKYEGSITKSAFLPSNAARGFAPDAQGTSSEPPIFTSDFHCDRRDYQSKLILQLPVRYFAVTGKKPNRNIYTRNHGLYFDFILFVPRVNVLLLGINHRTHGLFEYCAPQVYTIFGKWGLFLRGKNHF